MGTLQHEKPVRLTQIRLENYRCFEKIDLHLHPACTVLVAPNGGGKTALLDAAALVLQPFIDAMQGLKQSKGFRHADVRTHIAENGKVQAFTPTEFHAKGVFFDTSASWSRVLSNYTANARTSSTGLHDLRALEPAKSDIWPLIAYYGTGRLWVEHKLMDKKSQRKRAITRESGYDNCLTSYSNFKYMQDWFGSLTLDAFSARQANAKSWHDPERTLSMVREAINLALGFTGWHDIRWDGPLACLVATHSELGTRAVEDLSDGVRTIIGIVADIANRMIKLNPDETNTDFCSTCPGIVLIDEIDMHLHPGWQQVIISSLANAFKGLQFIMTTHSAQILTTVPSECIRILKDGKVFSAPAGTEGAEPGRLLKQVLGLSDLRPTANPAVSELREYLALVDQDLYNSPRALELRTILDNRYQGSEPDLIDADVRIENRKWERGE
jgi:predicted ATP-binding protein involved in virulence